jgi:hypothetical protein
MMFADRPRLALVGAALALALALATAASARGEIRCLHGDCKNGYGTAEIADARTTRGTWVQGYRHGYGLEETADGKEIWQGAFANGSLNGPAVYITLRERIAYYVGSWKDGRFHGYGVYVTTIGARFSGEYVDGLWQGQGEFSGPGGERYEGGVANERFEGVGTLSLPGIRRYTGSWKAGLREGEGEETFLDGVFVYRGSYRADEPSGAGRVWMDGREVHQGPIDPKTGYGFGVRKDDSGFFYVGELFDGHPHGRGAQRMQGGEVITGLWVGGTRSGALAPKD